MKTAYERAAVPGDRTAAATRVSTIMEPALDRRSRRLVPDKWPRKSLLALGLSVSIKFMARSRFFAVGALDHRGVRRRRRRLRPQRRRVGGSAHRALPDVHRGARCHRDALRRQGQVRPAGLRRDLRHAADARSAFELHGSAAVRAAARAAGRALLRARHHHPGRSTATSPWWRSSKARPRTRRASAAATSSRRSTARTPRAGRAIRPCASCAARRARRVEVSLKRAGLRPADHARRAARRDHDSDDPRRVHGRRHRPATSGCRTSPRTRIAISAARSPS